MPDVVCDDHILIVVSQRDAIGYVSQDGLESVTLSLSVEDNLFYRASLLASLRHSDDSIHKHVDAILERCDLTSKRNSTVVELNKGQTKRLAIAMELLANDSVLFLDEPLLGLDGAAALRVMTIIKSEALIQGKCVVMVSNQPRGDIFDLFDDLLLMKNGRTLYCGTAVQFKKKILPQFDEILYDSCGDRIMSHLTQFDDLYLPENFNAKVITADMVRAHHSNVPIFR
jgi:ABC-type multidrug transport system ATPase subunit